jgi:hypothetical protein
MLFALTCSVRCMSREQIEVEQETHNEKQFRELSARITLLNASTKRPNWPSTNTASPIFKITFTSLGVSIHSIWVDICPFHRDHEAGFILTFAHRASSLLERSRILAKAVGRAGCCRELSAQAREYVISQAIQKLRYRIDPLSAYFPAMKTGWSVL